MSLRPVAGGQEAQSEGSPWIFSRAWGRAGRTTERFSRTARGLPGRFTIRDLRRMPANARQARDAFTDAGGVASAYVEGAAIDGELVAEEI